MRVETTVFQRASGVPDCAAIHMFSQALYKHCYVSCFYLQEAQESYEHEEN